MISDVKLPAKITIERDSCYALLGGRYGNVFCALMSLPEGVIYSAPYTHDAARPAWTPQSVGGLTEYTHQANCAGRPIRKIYHQEGGIAGHEQLAIFLAEAGVVPAQGFVGFSILFSPEKGGLGTTSRSQNNPHFRDWMGLTRDQDKAFKKYHADEQAKLEGVQGPPTFHDVTTPASDGALPPTWADAIKRCLQSKLGRDYVSSTQVSIKTPTAASTAPAAPPL
jgi:hypothetical protein